ncbi:DUF1801 domain-containing protein [Arenibacter sp. M-2]|uniref:DUF1801 domain-containing protein n=1 Tax=Arenibacter sp. M-2 TaxID=3053612 RepID=UPI00257072F2|nr:DUF1801 domain-containing protein [Arenibacter sp. M-2]MDL5510608.1 DUF1801 domain-containing protein [Arenibacter sp. M-2]|tara:strand:- start:23836 stop:24264 length:429 start_codon:yes stop_codon:yes gene_type:complete
MKDLRFKTDSRVESVFNNYPPEIRKKLEILRSLIIESAQNIESLSLLEETLKWSEPSYIAKNGSTIRIDWKPKNPDQYAMYFQCTSKLIPTFKMVYHNMFRFEGSRAIIFHLKDSIPKKELQACITAALTYHQVKHLPSLGL